MVNNPMIPSNINVTLLIAVIMGFFIASYIYYKKKIKAKKQPTNS